MNLFRDWALVEREYLRSEWRLLLLLCDDPTWAEMGALLERMAEVEKLIGYFRDASHSRN